MKINQLIPLVVAMGTLSLAQEAPSTYPQPSMDKSVVEDYFGQKVADPYRSLEDDLAPETIAWVKKQNQCTQDYLSKIPYREAMKARLTELYNYPKFGVPAIYGDYMIFGKNDGLQNQMIIYKQKKGSDQVELLLDPNTFRADGTAALVSTSVSQDNKYLAYSVSKSGSDWVEIYVRDIATGKDLEDCIEWVKFSGAEWTKDGFYYSRYAEPKGSAYSSQNENQQVYYHKLGTPQSEDKLVYADPANPMRYFSASVSGDNKYLFIHGSEGTSGTEILYREREAEGAFKPLCKGFEYDFSLIDAEGDVAYIVSNELPNSALYKYDLKTGERTIFIPESKHMLTGVSKLDDCFYLTYLENAATKVYQYSLEGKMIREIKFPTLGSAGGFYARKGVDTTYYSFSSFNYPSEVFSLDVKTGESKPVFPNETSFDPEDFTVEQLEATSKDGTKVPYFIVYKKGMKRDGNNPVHLYSYGGFRANMTPGFTPHNIMFMEQGGIYAHAIIRGGSEFGEQWHKDGMKANKQNVFDDFIAVGEDLIAKEYTSSKRLAVSGASNGGLLIGACVTQRPDLYAVTFPIVGVLDMMRFHKFTIGWGWIVEYGCSENEVDFNYLIKYSPLHNVKKGTNYPATMIMTGDHDDRVVPAHSFKFGAAMQAAQAGEAPILLRVDTDAGHGAGKPMYKIIDEKVDMYSFMFYNMDFTPKF